MRKPTPNRLTNEEKESIIKNALYGDSDVGRQALAEAMVAPIIRAIDYQSIGRKLFGVPQLPQEVLYRIWHTDNKYKIVEILRKIEKIKNNL